MATKDKNDQGSNDESKNSPDNTNSSAEKDKKIAELEKKLGEQGEQLGKYAQYEQQMATVINTIAYNPDLKKNFRKAYAEATGYDFDPDDTEDKSQDQKPDEGKKDTKPNDEGKKLDARVSGVEESRREEILSDFETKYGISKLKADEQKDFRQKLGVFFREFGSDIRTVPLPQLRSTLDKAYTAIHAEKLKEEGKLEGYVQATNNAQGALPSIDSSTPNTQPKEGELTGKQKQWAEKFGLDTEKVAKTKADEDKEYKRLSPMGDKK